jgi:hypothetical protein
MPAGESCISHATTLNNLLGICNESFSLRPIQCRNVTLINTDVLGTDSAACEETAVAMNSFLDLYQPGASLRSAIECTPGGFLKSNANCPETVGILNQIIDATQDGTFTDCSLSTPTTTPSTTSSSTATTTATSTVTSTATITLFDPAAVCFELGGTNYFAVESHLTCVDYASALNALASSCGPTAGALSCDARNGVSFQRSISSCFSTAQALNAALAEFTFAGEPESGSGAQPVAMPATLGCTLGGYLKIDGDCSVGVQNMNSMLRALRDGSFTNCVRSSPTTTATTTVTSTVTSTATSTVTTTPTTAAPIAAPEVGTPVSFLGSLSVTGPFQDDPNLNESFGSAEVTVYTAAPETRRRRQTVTSIAASHNATVLEIILLNVGSSDSDLSGGLYTGTCGEEGTAVPSLFGNLECIDDGVGGANCSAQFVTGKVLTVEAMANMSVRVFNASISKNAEVDGEIALCTVVARLEASTAADSKDELGATSRTLMIVVISSIALLIIFAVWYKKSTRAPNKVHPDQVGGTDDTEVLETDNWPRPDRRADVNTDPFEKEDTVLDPRRSRVSKHRRNQSKADPFETTEVNATTHSRVATRAAPSIGEDPHLPPLRVAESAPPQSSDGSSLGSTHSVDEIGPLSPQTQRSGSGGPTPLPPALSPVVRGAPMGNLPMPPLPAALNQSPRAGIMKAPRMPPRSMPPIRSTIPIARASFARPGTPETLVLPPSPPKGFLAGTLTRTDGPGDAPDPFNVPARPRLSLSREGGRVRSSSSELSGQPAPALAMPPRPSPASKIAADLRARQPQETPSPQGPTATIPANILSLCKKMSIAFHRIISTEKVKLSTIFHTSFDANGTGMITHHEFVAGVSKIGAQLNLSQIDDLFAYLDAGSKGHLVMRDFGEIVKPFRKRKD